MFSGLKRKLERAKTMLSGLNELITYRDMFIEEATDRRVASSRNPMNQFGWKAFSQNDEDGLTLEILRRLGIVRGRFLEFGVGDGLENNSIVLLGHGWKGVWVGEEIKPCFGPGSRGHFLKRWVDGRSLEAILRDARAAIGDGPFDMISMDLDGNDIHFVEQLLSAGEKPALWIVEYNAKFVPPIRFSVSYYPNHMWDKTDYQGASLQSFVDLFDQHDYALVVCNAWSGSNAFFVHKSAMAAFPEVPSSIKNSYMPAAYSIRRSGHPTSARTVEILASAKIDPAA